MCHRARHSSKNWTQPLMTQRTVSVCCHLMVSSGTTAAVFDTHTHTHTQRRQIKLLSLQMREERERLFTVYCWFQAHRPLSISLSTSLCASASPSSASFRPPVNPLYLYPAISPPPFCSSLFSSPSSPPTPQN